MPKQKFHVGEEVICTEQAKDPGFFFKPGDRLTISEVAKNGSLRFRGYPLWHKPEYFKSVED